MFIGMLYDMRIAKNKNVLVVRKLESAKSQLVPVKSHLGFQEKFTHKWFIHQAEEVWFKVLCFCILFEFWRQGKKHFLSEPPD